MALVRVINCISYKRLITVSSLRNRCILPSFRQNALYSTKKSIVANFLRLGNQNKRNIDRVPFIIAAISCFITICFGLYECFSDKSEMNIIFSTIDYCNKNPKVTRVLGNPVVLRSSVLEMFSDPQAYIKKYDAFEVNGVQHVKKEFDIMGPIGNATVKLEMQEDESGNFVYKYLYLYVHRTNRVVVLEDRKQNDDNEIVLEDIEKQSDDNEMLAM
ncbi:Mitochondrial import inner membrane translocase subunit Tim21 [Melipona quadrifasciata]|uniref:Mitochondrial import inner membrane translocase subunit Tim21 n=1 Tax=Melipona quadrifasciata TaxID=166423 RepID=A0A0N0BJ85_9HYME|nr:Mitochondrial import inner membrane translocase subunit Tim21 [Melipona quadrifasciata]